MSRHIGIIGLGHMGGAMAQVLSEVLPKGSVFGVDPHAEKRNRLKKVRTFSNVSAMLPHVAAVILAMKPQSFDASMKDMGGMLSDKLVISIMAGISLPALQKKTGSKRCIRSMPNLGVQTRQGVIGWVSGSLVSKKEKKYVQMLFSTMGESIELKKESEINSLGAISGCGPAYFFYLTNLLEQYAKQCGLSRKDAGRAARMTYIGSASLFEKDHVSGEEWIARVASKGGVTEEALRVLKTEAVGERFFRAFQSAVRRTEELGT
ncbi:MAG: hypothetical protein A3G08_04490 [Candidatus Magasanikbacteria bacterium RIFCSPLOWO2_12_FULL_47_9b]|nr:MAG: hypothetical protein A3C10_02425 [Candidatus Magasanikbacteria bacterium RIFCSPHIGHO2_02_FULL_48_18]OGH82926.1 MAG: hypothetical protein A3G08_04490 [Candidatus Magasanikbacteria bacterium RIFCSPLOWO2_12_FULL_47_9b]